MHPVPALCILITAWYAPVLADEPSDIDAMILAGLENQTVTDEIERVLEDEDTLLTFEPACCLAEEQIAGVSHSTYERIRQTYATPERVTNLQEQHIKRDSKVDLTFRGMPYASEAWLVRLIVTIVIIVVIAVVTWYCWPAPVAIPDAVMILDETGSVISEETGSLISDGSIEVLAPSIWQDAASNAAVIAYGTRPVKPCGDFLEAMDILKNLATDNAEWAYIEFPKGDFNAWAPYASPLPAP